MCVPFLFPVSFSSLSAPTPLYRILGNLPQESSSAKFILTHKYVLVRPPADPRTLLGYFLSSSYLRALVSDLLSLCLSQLADCSVIRHMSSQHHLRLSGIVVIATTCFDPKWVDKKIISGNLKHHFFSLSFFLAWSLLRVCSNSH